MVSTKLAFMSAIAMLVLQASWCAVAQARHHHDPDPAVSAQGGTHAVMTVDSFRRNGDGKGAPSECDGHYHSDKDLIAALSTRWYAGGKRCLKPIRITSTQTGRTVVARVVDECDSHQGCKNNIVDTSQAVWDALGLDSNIGEVPVIWSDA